MNVIHDRAELAAIDLNLLVALDALLAEQNVTRAAERLHVTQSALSHALRRLRELFDDALLVRSGSTMLPTPRAEALAEPVRDALRAVQRALSGPETFDPASSRRSFTIAAPDIIDLVLVPRLLARISELAPNVDLSIAPFEPAPFDRLASGELDLAIGVRIADRSASVPEVREPGLERRTLVRDRFVCFLRARKARLTLARYTQLGHILVSPTGRGPGLVDDALAKRRLTRRVALRVPHFHSALAITAESDLVLTAPAALTTLAKRFGLCTLPPPLPLPEHSVDLIWHQRFAADPGHRWLRDQIAAVARNL